MLVQGSASIADLVAGLNEMGASADDLIAVLKSLKAGSPVAVPGPHESIMAGLNCDRPSPIAWPTGPAAASAAARCWWTDRSR